MEELHAWRSHGGTQKVFRHFSEQTQTPMTFSVFVPHVADKKPLPVVYFLSGLTCTHANVTEKGEFRRACAALGLIFVAPDTSPRGEGVADDPNGAYDFGLGAGFYLDATLAPFAKNYRMGSYVAHELPALVAKHFPVDVARQSIMGHSMGGHGALTLALRRPGHYRAVSAFAPLVAPSQSGWGRKALAGYLGPQGPAWRQHDAVALLQDGAQIEEILVDQGTGDHALEQLRPELLQAACKEAGVSLTLRHQAGYDHSYYFVATFMADHLAWHAERLRR